VVTGEFDARVSLFTSTDTASCGILIYSVAVPVLVLGRLFILLCLFKDFSVLQLIPEPVPLFPGQEPLAASHVLSVLPKRIRGALDQEKGQTGPRNVATGHGTG
jgi:hypothetical protein